MANADRPQGFSPVGKVKQVIRQESGAAIFPGDCAHLESDGLVDPAVNNEDILGVCMSLATAANKQILVSVDPAQEYVAQADETEINVQSDVGNVMDIVSTAGNTTYNTSRQECDSSEIAISGAKQLVLLGIERGADNAFGAQVDCRVKINENQIFGEPDFAGI